MSMFEHRIDLSLKHITFELDGKSYLIHFKSGFFRGVHDVQVFSGEKGALFLTEPGAEIKSAYPSFAKRVKEAALLFRSYLDNHKRGLKRL